MPISGPPISLCDGGVPEAVSQVAAAGVDPELVLEFEVPSAGEEFQLAAEVQLVHAIDVEGFDPLQPRFVLHVNRR